MSKIENSMLIKDHLKVEGKTDLTGMVVEPNGDVTIGKDLEVDGHIIENNPSYYVYHCFIDIECTLSGYDVTGAIEFTIKSSTHLSDDTIDTTTLLSELVSGTNGRQSIIPFRFVMYTSDTAWLRIIGQFISKSSGTLTGAKFAVATYDDEWTTSFVSLDSQRINQAIANGDAYEIYNETTGESFEL